MRFVLVGTHRPCISVIESGQSFLSIKRPREMVTLVVYLELEGIFWVRAGNGAQKECVHVTF